MKPNTPSSTSSKSSDSKIQGEGDYESAKKYNQETEQYAKSGQSESDARKAAPQNQDEAESMRRAEDEGRSHAKGSSREATDGNTAGRTQPSTEVSGNQDSSTRKVPGR